MHNYVYIYIYIYLYVCVCVYGASVHYLVRMAKSLNNAFYSEILRTEATGLKHSLEYAECSRPCNPLTLRVQVPKSEAYIYTPNHS